MRVSIPKDETYEGLRSHYPEFSNQGVFTTQSQMGGQHEQGESFKTSMQGLMGKIGSKFSQLNPFSSETTEPSREEEFGQEKHGRRKMHGTKQMGGMGIKGMHGRFEKERFEEQPSHKTKFDEKKRHDTYSTESHLDTLTEQKLKSMSGKGSMGGIHGGSRGSSEHEGVELHNLFPEEEADRIEEKPSWSFEKSRMQPMEMSEREHEHGEFGSGEMSDVSTEHMADRDINRYNPESPTLRQRLRRSSIESHVGDISQRKQNRMPIHMVEEEEELEPSFRKNKEEEEREGKKQHGSRHRRSLLSREGIEEEEEEEEGQMHHGTSPHAHHGSRYRGSPLTPREEEGEEEEEEGLMRHGPMSGIHSGHMSGIHSDQMREKSHQMKSSRMRRSTISGIERLEEQEESEQPRGGHRERTRGTSGLEKLKNVLQGGKKQHEIKSWKTSEHGEVDENAIFYIGFAQNSLTGLMALSKNPSLAEKIKLFIGIGTIGTGQYAHTPLMKLLKTVDLDDIFSQEMIFMNPDERFKMAEALCTDKVDLANVVFGEPEDVFYFFGGENKHVDRVSLQYIF
jgi:hypothetical protein